MDDIKASLALNPLPPGANLEPFSSKHLPQGYRLAKYYFRVPGLSGAAREGRLLYLIDDTTQSVILLTVYSHKNYEKRPPDSLIKDLIGEAKIIREQ